MGDESSLRHLAVPVTGTGPAVLVIHSWWGLTPSFTTYADTLARHGFVAGCVDLFDGATATTEAQARHLRGRPRREPAYRTLQNCLRDLGAHPSGTGAPPGVVGFSMGGHWAIWLAQHAEPPIGPAVVYYAARGGNFADTRSSLTAHFADDDPFVTASARRTMQRALERHAVAFQPYDYPGTRHWFAEPTDPAYDPSASALAVDRTIAALSTVTTPDMRPDPSPDPD